MRLTIAHLQEVLQRYGGVLTIGSHDPDNAHVCALELYALATGGPEAWTDGPRDIFDVRPLNDIPVSDEQRTARMLPILVAYAGSRRWPLARQVAVVSRLAILTVQRLVAELPGLSEAQREVCRRAETLSSALAAAESVWPTTSAACNAAQACQAALSSRDLVARRAYASKLAADAASCAAHAAHDAAHASDAPMAVFDVACQLFLDAAEASHRWRRLSGK